MRNCKDICALDFGGGGGGSSSLQTHAMVKTAFTGSARNSEQHYDSEILLGTAG